MKYVFKLNLKSKDPRVKILAEILLAKNYMVLDWQDATTQPAIYYLEPRCQFDNNLTSSAVAGSIAFGYQKQTLSIPFISLNDDNVFINDNNLLTAKAFAQILSKDYHGTDKKILICGWGKLATALATVLTDWQISVLNFNFHKIPELIDKYQQQAYFETAPYHEFPIIVNTIPKPLLKPITWHKNKQRQIIYDLASAPYGFDWTGVSKDDYDYRILPALPGNYYPNAAAQAVFDAIMRYLDSQAKPMIVLGITGSACSYLKLLPILKEMVQYFEIIPVLSPHADQPNRFTDINVFKEQIRQITGHNLITNIAGAETLSAKSQIRASVIFPATGNTLAKLAHGITDTCVLMAAKALLRNGKPCIIGLSTNDALSGNAQNIGILLNRKHVYFVPFGQDDVIAKPYSCVCDFTQIISTIQAALRGEQIQPILRK